MIFPRTCSGCATIGTFFCDTCLAGVPRAEPSKESFISAIFDYQNPAIRNAIWRLKYRNVRELANHFGEFLYDSIIGDIGDDLRVSKNEVYLVVPVPLHPKRLRERGYNQSELLAKDTTRYDTEKILEITTGALIRTRATKPQAKSDKRVARFENLKGAFTARSEQVRGRHVILIDDVTTTGATLAEARKAILKAGAKTVRAYAVAH